MPIAYLHLTDQSSTPPVVGFHGFLPAGSVALWTALGLSLSEDTVMPLGSTGKLNILKKSQVPVSGSSRLEKRA